MTPSDAPATDYVLVVDDDADVREAIQDAVETAGCRAVVASNGLEALQLINGSRPCLVVLDLWMPVMNGFQFLERLRSDPTRADIPIVISTSAPKEAPKDVPLLPKPIDLDALLALLRTHCPCVTPA